MQASNMLSSICRTFLYYTLCAQLAYAVDPLVKLPYSEFAGTVQSNGITQWLGIPFAAPPVGELRFAPPSDPPIKTGVQQADKVRPRLQKATYQCCTDLWT